MGEGKPFAAVDCAQIWTQTYRLELLLACFKQIFTYAYM